jgi:prepilin-type N-terminal cleavage/methylation domain-containing protein
MNFKTKKSPASGFTLIELLTVIAIIGILAAIIIPTTGAVRNAAKKAQTKSQFNNWVSAMVLFKQEYGYLPTEVAQANKIASDRFAGALTGRTLAGVAITATTQLYGNRKKMSFYSFSDNDLDNPTTPTAIVDAFGNTDIAIYMDRNGNGIIESGAPDSGGQVTVISVNSTTARTPTITYPVRAPVVFYSAGRGESNSDIIYSWK